MTDYGPTLTYDENNGYQSTSTEGAAQSTSDTPVYDPSQDTSSVAYDPTGVAPAAAPVVDTSQDIAVSPPSQSDPYRDFGYGDPNFPSAPIHNPQLDSQVDYLPLQQVQDLPVVQDLQGYQSQSPYVQPLQNDGNILAQDYQQQ